MSDLTQVLADARDALQRLERRLRRRDALLGLERAEPQLFLAPQFDRTGRSSARRPTRSSTWPPTTGIKAGNPNALVAAGETSNRGHNHPTGGVSDSAAPATFARLLSVANPKLPFDAWATHPYPSVYALGPAQRVAYPNVAFSTMTRFGDDLRSGSAGGSRSGSPSTASRRRRSTTSGGVSYAQQAQDVKKALAAAAAEPVRGDVRLVHLP